MSKTDSTEISTLFEDALRGFPQFANDQPITDSDIREAAKDIHRMIKALREIKQHGPSWGGSACAAHALLGLGQFNQPRTEEKPTVVVVPIEPTPEMLRAGCEAGLATATLLDDTRFACERAVWAAMVKTGVGVEL